MVACNIALWHFTQVHYYLIKEFGFIDRTPLMETDFSIIKNSLKSTHVDYNVLGVYFKIILGSKINFDTSYIPQKTEYMCKAKKSYA